MSILAGDIPGARVLDLFAGSGALGLEALSRGAASAHFVELDRRAHESLRRNVATMGMEESATVTRRDAVEFAGRLDEGAYDLVFADPPYGSPALAELLALFRTTPFGRILSVEHPAALGNLGDQTRRYGTTAISFLYSP